MSTITHAMLKTTLKLLFLHNYNLAIWPFIEVHAKLKKKKKTHLNVFRLRSPESLKNPINIKLTSWGKKWPNLVAAKNSSLSFSWVAPCRA